MEAWTLEGCSGGGQTLVHFGGGRTALEVVGGGLVGCGSDD